MSDELLSCPFCGSANVSDSQGRCGDNTPFQYIECEDCEATSGGAQTTTEATLLWNQRAPSAVQEETELEKRDLGLPGGEEEEIAREAALQLFHPFSHENGITNTKIILAAIRKAKATPVRQVEEGLCRVRVDRESSCNEESCSLIFGNAEKPRKIIKGIIGKTRATLIAEEYNSSLQVPKGREFWINVFHDQYTHHQIAHNSREVADACATTDSEHRVDCIHVREVPKKQSL